ncbi:MAG: GIY-YIG nuclease family protein [Bacteroidetes bacterium]|nr:GIY-YIG nuclease family protein [Bacteroidota bacterium]
MPPCHLYGRRDPQSLTQKSGALSFMPYYVYIIQSQIDSTFYKGSTENPLNRLEQHNLGHTLSTRLKRPWKLVYIEQLPTKTEMLIREKKLKRGNKEYFEKLMKGDKNILDGFIKK